MGSTKHRIITGATLLPAAGLLSFASIGIAIAQTAATDASQSSESPETSAQQTQTTETPQAGESSGSSSSGEQSLGDVVVTGIRQSLESATEAKRDSITFGDSIYAEDIGKLPATNLAETLNRIPGVKLNRDINGEGFQISVRGLGPSFSKVLLNNTQIAVASDGGTNGGSANREVDLDFFPSELFTRLDVQKSPIASTLEGGIAGTVNLRSARPFDRPGQHLTFIAQGEYTDSNSEASPRGALIGSKTWDKFGVLFGVSGVKAKTRIDGFESVGWTNGNTNLTYPTVVPDNTGYGLVPGTGLDIAATSGLPLATIKSALIPRLGRDSYTFGDRSRISGLISMEYQATDTLQFALDTLYAKSDRDYQRLNMNWYVRNSGPGDLPTSTGGMVPINVTVDSNNVVTSGTFANSSFFLENDVFDQTTKFWNINPNMHWEARDNLNVDAQINYGHSTFFREQPQFDFQTPRESGLTVTYQSGGSSGQPIITTNRNLNDPNLGWQWYRVNAQSVERETTTKGAHIDATFGDKDANIRTGFAYDDAARTIRAYDNSSAFQTAVCGATCDGVAGLVPNSQVARYLRPMDISNFGHLSDGAFGYNSFIMTNLDALKAATNYAYYRDTAPESRSAVTGGAVGDIQEKTAGLYAESNLTTEYFKRDLHLNFGIRYFHTAQTVTSPIQNQNGGLFDQTLDAGYEDFLPSINTVYDLADSVKLRASASRSITRADAQQLLPGTTLSDTSVQNATAGNPDLKPYSSNNIDIGGEYYTGGIGYVGVALFRKNVEGFTTNTQTTVKFSDLGIPFSALSPTQRDVINGKGGPDAYTLTLTKPVNLGALQLEGLELTWVQPLDFVLQGLGFSANGTRITQSSDTGLVAPGIARYSYNLQSFYEARGLSVSLNYVWSDDSIAANPPQNSINVPLKADARGQLDLSAGYQLPFFGDAFRVTLDALNLTNEPLRTTFGYDNAPYSVYYPGRQFLLGVRGNL